MFNCLGFRVLGLSVWDLGSRPGSFQAAYMAYRGTLGLYKG